MATTEWDDSIEVIETIEESVVKEDNSVNIARTQTVNSSRTAMRQNTLDNAFTKEPRNHVRDPSHSSSVSARDRAKEFINVTHEDGGLLFCSMCNLVIDHTRKSSVISHLETAKHRKRSQTAVPSGVVEEKQKTSY